MSIWKVDSNMHSPCTIGKYNYRDDKTNMFLYKPTTVYRS